MITDLTDAYLASLTFWAWALGAILAILTILTPLAALTLTTWRLRNTRPAWWLRTLPTRHRTTHTDDHYTPLT